MDGGLYANNPSACALVESICYFDQKLDDVVLLSLGTGEYTKSILFKDARNWGLAKWAQPVLNVVFDGVSDTVNYQVQSLLTKGGVKGRYLRVQPALTDDNDEMDDASDDNLADLTAVAERLIALHDEQLDAMAAVLTGQTPPDRGLTVAVEKPPGPRSGERSGGEETERSPPPRMMPPPA